MLYGLDFLGGARYPEVVVKNHPKGFAFGVFLEVDGFGKADGLIEKMARSGKAPAIRVHLMWKDNHDFTAKDFPEIERRARRLHKIAVKYSGIGWYVSGCCEHNLREADARKLASMLKRACPSATFVNCPLKGAILKGEINEVHNKHSKPAGDYIYSYDGEACVDSDIEARKRQHKDCRIFFLWEPRFNGRWESNDTTPRPQRKGWPDSKLIQSVVRLSREKLVAVKLPKNWLWKSHSENHGKGDKRAEKPVLICPIKATKIKLVSDVGHVIGELNYYGAFDGGGYRYYSNKWGFELEQDMIAESAKSEVFFFVNGKKFGPVNPSFRAGKFR